MKQRCQNPNHPKYLMYGGRGIFVSQRWQKFEAFLEDMGERPDGTSLDRIDNDGPYTAENCRWATPKQQQNNQRGTQYVRYGGAEVPISYLADMLGISKGTLKYRVAAGWSERHWGRKPHHGARLQPR